jgi:hypothetical protein
LHHTRNRGLARIAVRLHKGSLKPFGQVMVVPFGLAPSSGSNREAGACASR